MFVDYLRLVGPGGSNKVMAGELSRLARRALAGEVSRELLRTPPKKVAAGSLRYPFDPRLAGVAGYYHRTSTRVLWDLYESSEVRLEPLFDEFFQDVCAERRSWLKTGARISIHAFGLGHLEAGERQAVGVAKNALIEGAQSQGIELILDPDHADLVFNLRALRDQEGNSRVVLSLDLAGRPMHERGYRIAAGIAPIREDLAAQLVMLLRYDARKEHLIDPMAGSGTLGIEAALMAAGRPLWMSGRVPTLASIPEIAETLSARPPALFDDTEASISLAEVDNETYQLQDRALTTAGVNGVDRHNGDFRDFRVQDFLNAEGEKKPKVVLCNPPYGARLDHEWEELEILYRDLGSFCRAVGVRRAGFIVGEGDERASNLRLFERAFGGRPRIKKAMHNGPIRAQFLLYDWDSED